MYYQVGRLFGDRTLARARNVSWQGNERGELTVSRGEVCVSEKRKPLQFWKKPHVVLRIPMVLIISVEVASGSNLLIRRMDEEDTPFEDEVTFRRRDEPKQMADLIDHLLDELGGESRQAKLESAERDRKEREDRERQAEFRAVGSEKELVWKTAGQIRQIISELSRLIMALKSEDWEVIDQSWRKARALEEKSILNFSDNLDSFLPAIESRAADQVYMNTLGFFELLRSFLDEVQISRAEQEALAIRHESLPRWYHFPYFLSFILLYAETMLCHKAGDASTVSDNISRLQQLSVILQEVFRLNLADHITLFEAALSTGDSEQARRTGQDMESYIAEVIEREAGVAS